MEYEDLSVIGYTTLSSRFIREPTRVPLYLKLYTRCYQFQFLLPLQQY
jgi:hypothetical protein